jgi:hypothetical protein
MPLNYFPGQAPLAKASFCNKEKPESAIVLSPPMIVLITIIPSLTTISRTNKLDNFIPPYRIVAYSTPPIPPMCTGVPQGLVPDSYFNKFSAHNRIPCVEPRSTPITNMEECLVVIIADFNKQHRETFVVDLQSKSCLYQKHYPSHFD